MVDDRYLLLHELKRSLRLHRQLMTQLAGEHRMPPGQAACLREIAHHPGDTQREIAEALDISRPTLTVMLQKLEKAGLIERRTDESDQRFIRLHLTPEGMRMHDRMHGVLATAVAQTAGVLDESDRAELLRLLGLLNEKIQTALLSAEADGRKPDDDERTGTE